MHFRRGMQERCAQPVIKPPAPGVETRHGWQTDWTTASLRRSDCGNCGQVQLEAGTQPTAGRVWSTAYQMETGSWGRRGRLPPLAPIVGEDHLGLVPGRLAWDGPKGFCLTLFFFGAAVRPRPLAARGCATRQIIGGRCRTTRPPFELDGRRVESACGSDPVGTEAGIVCCSSCARFSLAERTLPLARGKIRFTPGRTENKPSVRVGNGVMLFGVVGVRPIPVPALKAQRSPGRSASADRRHVVAGRNNSCCAAVTPFRLRTEHCALGGSSSEARRRRPPSLGPVRVGQLIVPPPPVHRVDAWANREQHIIGSLKDSEASRQRTVGVGDAHSFATSVVVDARTT